MPHRNIGHILSVNDKEVIVQMAVSPEQANEEKWGVRPGQVGSYVVIPQNYGDLLAMVTAQRAREQGRRSVDATEQPNTVIILLAVGTIRQGQFRRGITHYPIVGESVRLAEEEDLAAIFSSWDSPEKDQQTQSQQTPTALPSVNHSPRLALGKFTHNRNYEVSLDGKAFCARHAAILGSSGSGKSCTVAQVVQQAVALPGTQVVLFDLHGEYLSAFSNDDGTPLPNVAYIGGHELVLPYWLLKYEEMDISKVIRDACTLFQPLAEVKAMTMICTVPDLCHLQGDTKMIQRMIANLLDNAIKYTPSEGTVEISLHTGDEKSVVVSIRDTGMGISQQDLPHVFERFYRGEAGHASDIPGTGLGLAICKEIIDRHDGRITVESQVGHGTIFTAWLPVASFEEEEMEV